MDDWTDGADVFDTGSTNNITYLVATSDIEVLTVGKNYAMRGTWAGTDFTFAAAGADTLIFKAANADLTNAANLFTRIDDEGGNLTNADFF